MPVIYTPTATTSASAAVAVNVVVRDGGISEAMQLMNVADGITGAAATVSASGLFIPANAANAEAVYTPLTTGTWSYYAGVSGTVNLTANQRILSIAAHSTSGGSFSINGGSNIPIVANTAYYVAPLGNLTAASVVFTSTDSYMIEILS